MTDRPKTCSTCAHKSGSKCMQSGYYIETARKYQIRCDLDFSCWVKREPLLTRIKKWLYQS